MATNFFDKASLVLVPSGYKAGKLYSVKPDDGNGDFTITRNSVATRVNEQGLIDEVAIDVPRLKYPSCPSLLLEAPRTNSLLYSEDYSDAVWGAVKPNITANQVDSPLGALTGWKVDYSGGVPATNRFQQNRTGLSGNVVIWNLIQKGTPTYHVLRLQGADISGVWFNMNTLTADTTVNGGTTAYVDSGAIDMGNDWYIVWAEFSGFTSTCNMLIYASNTDGAYTISSDDYYYIACSQMEVGAYPTSYIPTGSSTATRAVDSIALTGLQTNSLLGSVGSFYFSGKSQGTGNAGTFRLRNDATATYRLSLYDRLTTKLGYQIRVAGGDIMLGELVDHNTDFKVLIKYDATTVYVYLDGVLHDSAAGVIGTNIDELWENIATCTFDIYEMALFNTELTDAQCKELTT